MEKEGKKRFISLSVYTNEKQKLSLCTTRKFNPWFKDANIFKNETLYLLFMHCDDDKIYVFYNAGIIKLPSFTCDKVLLMTICVKKFSVIKVELVKNLIKNFDEIDPYKTMMCIFSKKMFFLKDEHKLFIKRCCRSRESLVFDTKNHLFYFNTEINPQLLSKIHSTNGNTVYEVSDDYDVLWTDFENGTYGKKEWTEIRSYQYENGRLVADRIKVKRDKKSSFLVIMAAQYV